ncbi:MAG TPA: hypothetical protein VMY88_06495 [Acidimicrobiales bacterium]|nr:hypothetical protein [Acidimicrobiales bacterium]
MRKLVVSSDGGAFITGIDVEEHDLAGGVATCVRLFPESSIYIDGRLVDDETVATIKAALAAGIGAAMTESVPTQPASQPASPQGPEMVQDYNETLQRVFTDVRKHHVEVLRDMAESTRMIGRVLIEREREFADEAARQRELTRKSLADIDLLGRSVKATEFTNVLAVVGAPNEARARGSDNVTIGDLWTGFKRIFTGER